MNDNVPDPSVRRLSAYLRQLELLVTMGVESVSSRQLAEYMKVGAAQVRRDLTLFGQFGRPGVGYDVTDLIDRLRDILGTTQRWKVIVLGAGELSHALLRYPGFAARGFELVAAFDNDPKKVGTRIGDVPVHHIDELESVISQCGARLAVLAVPAEASQDLADRLGRAGIAGILNFAPPGLETCPGIFVSQVDITAHLEQLSFKASNAGTESHLGTS